MAATASPVVTQGHEQDLADAYERYHDHIEDDRENARDCLEYGDLKSLRGLNHCALPFSWVTEVAMFAKRLV